MAPSVHQKKDQKASHFLVRAYINLHKTWNKGGHCRDMNKIRAKGGVSIVSTPAADF